jgi:3-isopropylmalate/(R)-2-methylmalate dehydratase large subunit
MAQTLYQKLWERHRIGELPGGLHWLYVDRHYLYDMNSALIEGLRLQGIPVARPRRTIGVADHAISSAPGRIPVVPWTDPYIVRMREETRIAGIPLLDDDTPDQGIAHVSGPELGLTQPGMLVLCGDSHTSTHGALGALAWGIGATEVQTVLATQTVVQRPAPVLRVRFEGRCTPGVGAKDLMLALIACHGASGGAGHAVEFAGAAVAAMDMEARMTLCNMAVEFGAKVGLIGVDEKTIAYAASRPYAPKGALLDAAVADWRTLHSDEDAVFADEIVLDAGRVQPQVTWGISPEQAVGIDACVPGPERALREQMQSDWRTAYEYMAVLPGMPMLGLPLDHVFIGSCTNSRLSDLREAAALVRGRHVAPNTTAWVVPGSRRVQRAAEAEGLDRIFREAGFEWREPGCSMCAGSNGDMLKPQQRCLSTSNRNFVGRQGEGVRTHLASPATAAASAIAGAIADPRSYLPSR